VERRGGAAAYVTGRACPRRDTRSPALSGSKGRPKRSLPRRLLGAPSPRRSGKLGQGRSGNPKHRTGEALAAAARMTGLMVTFRACAGTRQPLRFTCCRCFVPRRRLT